MAAMSSGRKDKPLKRPKGGTTSLKKYRFESFHQRIAKINIHPLRRSHDLDVETDDTTSYFSTGLAQWKEMNLSENFTNFVREIAPLCDSLPHIIHHHNDIMTILATYIEQRDALSLEPLLDMLGRFAHDLGVKFESHFATAVTLVTILATSHQDIQVVEWTFTCLAWLFKYLSRLLVPDLRPLFHIMAPLLGKVPQKAHTTRFAAEAMSFLLKKAAVVYHKNPQPLIKITDCILEDLESIDKGQTNLDLYHHGLMTLFIESIKGIDRGIHSCGDSIFRCLIERYLNRDAPRTQTEPIVVGLSIGLIHHCEAATFTPILDIVFESIQLRRAESSSRSKFLHSQLLFVAAAVRKGSRVENWSGMLDALSLLLSLCAASSEEEIYQILKSAALLLQSAPLDITIPRLRSIMEVISDEKNSKHFMPFCSYFGDLGRDRFEDLLLPYFSKYAV
jgi:U3 small nucleolar RNA-associated protein 20